MPSLAYEAWRKQQWMQQKTVRAAQNLLLLRMRPVNGWRVKLAMATWFSATAVIEQLARSYALTPQDRSWITIAVQLGFVVGAVASSAIALPDVVAPKTLMRLGMLVSAASTSSH